MSAVRVGLVSDTHGLADPRLPDALGRCDLVLHAGDVVKEAVLAALAVIGPVTAVRGNCDAGTSLERLPEAAVVPLGALTALVIHDLGPRERPLRPAAALLGRTRPQVIVHGHSHRPGAAVVGDALFVNPGSAGPRRFSLPRAAAVLTVRGRTARVVWIDLASPELAPLLPPLEVRL